MKLERLLQPGKIGRLELRNRLVYPPLQNRGTDENLHATERMAEYFAERGRGGIGLITLQHSFCWPAAKLARGLELWDDDCIAPLAMLAEKVHATGAKIAIQLGGRGTKQDNGQQSVAPSAIRLSYEKEPPRALAVDEICYFVECYGQAARRVREAGFDAVEIHGAHGKFISQFLSPYTNRRTDEYGGTIEKCTRFPREIVAAIKRTCGSDFPVIFRMSLSDRFEGGLTVEQGLEEIRHLDKAGVDAFHVSGGSQEFVWNTDQSYFFPRMCQTDLSAAAKTATDKPVIAVSKIQDVFQAEQVLEQGKADFIAMGRPFLADPQALTKALEGRPNDIRRCVYCLNCTTWNTRPYLKERGFACTVNPEVLREREFDIVPTPTPKKIIVVGGGLAGMEAARVLALRGHDVELYEQEEKLGGQWRVAAKADYKTDFRSLLVWLEHSIKQAGVKVSTGVKVTADLLAAKRPDSTIIATGAVPRALPVDRPVSGGPVEVQAMDVIMGKITTGQRVVVVGGRYIGMEVAAQLAQEGKHVSLVEAMELGHGTIARLKGMYRNKLVETGVFIFDRSPVLRYSTTGIDIAHCGSMLSLPCDTVVLAVGTKPLDELSAELAGMGLECHVIGDCASIGDALVSMSAGATIGREL